MSVKNKGWGFIPLLLLSMAAFLPIVSCQSAPPPNDMPPPAVEQQAPEPAGVDRSELDRLDAAMGRATASRESALAVQASLHFPEEWARAESDYEAGRRAGRATVEAVNLAVASFGSAADLYDTLAENSAPIAARALEEARLAQAAAEAENARQAFQTALTGAEQSRSSALGNRASAHFPAEWRDAEAQLRTGRAAGRGSAEEMRAAATQLNALASTYNDLANRSRPLFERDEAQRALTAATTRTERSRRAAMNVNGQEFFPADWQNAEAQNQRGLDAPRNTAGEIQAATALLVAAADSYDYIAQRSGPLFTAARNEATAILQAATARADSSRRAAMDVEAQTHFPDEWREAEAQNTAARRARRTTPDEMREAAAQLGAAADSYDRLAQRTGPVFARERGAADNALQAAMARAQSSRQTAMDAGAQTYLPADWRTAEGQNTAANRARRNTTAEIRAAATLFATAADSFEDIAQRTGAAATAARNEANREFQAALARADGSRRAAVAAEAQANFPNEWDRAEAQNTAGRTAPRTTLAETRAATAQLTSAANGFDNITQRISAAAARAREEAERAERNEANREFQAALARADSSRRAAVAAEAQTHFPNEWDRAETQNTGGRAAPRTTLAETRAATAQLASAANGFDNIAQRSAAAATRARDDADRALQTAITRAERSRQAAVNAEAQTHFPAEWREAETQNTAATRARRNTLDEVRAATALFVTAANSYDDVARRSGAVAAAARNEANREFQAAAARADRSRRDAMAVEGQIHFAGDWERAEAQNTAARAAPRTTVAETRTVVTQLNAVADAFDNIAQRSGPVFAGAREAADTALQAAIARADGSRQAAVENEAQTFFPAEWRNAEAQNTAARRARRNTPEEMRAATALFVAAADSYDYIARRSGPMLVIERRDAERDLQAAIARATQSRQRAANTDAATNLPRDWNNLETRHRNTENARRGTVAEMRSAVNLFNASADAFDDIVQRNVRFVQENEAAARVARTNAERERQAAIDARANVAVPDDFGRADSTFQQALREFNAGNFVAARTQYTQSANQFVGSVRETERRRQLADTTVEQARQRSARSTALAISTGLAMEEDGET